MCLIVYNIGFSIGFGPLPWAMNAELFPREAQGVLPSLAGAFNWTCAFVVTKFSSDVEEAIKLSGLFFLFGAICAAGAVFVIVLVPETKGKSPDDMKKYFMGVRWKAVVM